MNIFFKTISIIMLSIAVKVNALSDIKIALVAPLNGPYQEYGKQLLSGAEYATAQINKNGGILGTRLSIIPFDDLNHTNFAQSVSLQLSTNDNIVAIIGHAASHTTIEALKHYRQYRKLVISPCSTLTNLNTHPYNLFFSLIGNNHLQAEITGKFLLHILKAKRIAILHDDYPYGIELSDLLTKFLVTNNQPPIFFQTIKRNTKSKQLIPILKSMHKLNLDAIYYASLYPEIQSLLRTDIYKKIPIITSDAIALNNISELIGDNNIKVMFSFSADHIYLPKSTALIKQLQVNGVPSSGYALYAYAAVEILAKALTYTKSTNPELLGKWLHNNNIDTILGPLSWDTNGNLANPQYHIYSLYNGQYQQLL